MSALTLQVASDLIAAHIGFVTGSIAREPAMPYRPLVSLPTVSEQFDRFFGGGALGVNVVERAPANNHEARRPASTPPQRTDAQPSRAVSPNPATIQHGGIAAKGIQR